MDQTGMPNNTVEKSSLNPAYKNGKFSASSSTPNPQQYKSTMKILAASVFLVILFLILAKPSSNDHRFIRIDEVDESRLKLIIPKIPNRKPKASLLDRFFRRTADHSVPKDDKKVQYATDDPKQQQQEQQQQQNLLNNLNIVEDYNHNAVADPDEYYNTNQNFSISSNNNFSPRYQPPVRYEPSPFPMGMGYNAYVDQTPLGMIRRGEVKMPSLPKDWDGGYGWAFVKYHPSMFEKEWYKEAKKVQKQQQQQKKDSKQHGLCHLLRTKFQKQLDIYLKWIEEHGRKQNTEDVVENSKHYNSNNNNKNNNNNNMCDKITNKKIELMSSGEGSFQSLFTSSPSSSANLDPTVFSTFEYVYMCTVPPCRSKPKKNGPRIGQRKFSFIEPLVGLLRHPEVCSKNPEIVDAHLMNRDYLVHDPRSLVHAGRSTISPVPRVLFFDAGAAYWDRDFSTAGEELLSQGSNMKISSPASHYETETDEDAENVNHQGEGAEHHQGEVDDNDHANLHHQNHNNNNHHSSKPLSQQAWFYNLYDSMCLHFDGMWMWESIFRNPREVFDTIPPHLRSIYRWFNVPLSVSTSSWDSPLNHILVEARKEDIVILKIDFDQPEKEIALIQQILDYPDVADLIDELYFEHHCAVEVLDKYWLTENLKEILHTDSVKLFTALRQRGIRAHAFV